MWARRLALSRSIFSLFFPLTLAPLLGFLPPHLFFISIRFSFSFIFIYLFFFSLEFTFLILVISFYFSLHLFLSFFVCLFFVLRFTVCFFLSCIFFSFFVYFYYFLHIFIFYFFFPPLLLLPLFSLISHYLYVFFLFSPSVSLYFSSMHLWHLSSSFSELLYLLSFSSFTYSHLSLFPSHLNNYNELGWHDVTGFRGNGRPMAQHLPAAWFPPRSCMRSIHGAL